MLRYPCNWVRRHKRYPSTEPSCDSCRVSGHSDCGYCISKTMLALYGSSGPLP